MPCDQYRCPSGEEGRAVIESMNEHHAPLSDWALSKLPPAEPARILDVGCGGGMLIGKLATRYPRAEVWGADISPESVAAALERNRALAASGRARVVLASVSDLPFDDGSFGLVTAVETYFFWPDPARDIVAAAAKLAPGGLMLIASEAYPDPRFDEANRRNSEEYGMRLLPNGELVSMMEAAGMDASAHTDEDRNWVAAVGVKRRCAGAQTWTRGAPGLGNPKYKSVRGDGPWTPEPRSARPCSSWPCACS